MKKEYYCDSGVCPVPFMPDINPCKECYHKKEVIEQDASSEFVDWFEKILKGDIK